MAGQAQYAQVKPEITDDTEPFRSHGDTGGKVSTLRRFYRKSILEDGWIAEIICATLGVVLVGALCLVLNAYDGKQAPHFGAAFGSALTLNTIVAIISAAAKAALLFPVAECVSQSKWLWFESDFRRLSDMATFDKASRGIVGGLGLM